MSIYRKNPSRLAGMILAISVSLLAHRAIGENASLETSVAADNELAELSIDELMKVDVTSVAGVKQEFFQTPAAMTVLKQDDIVSSGHQSLAELLRVVPGMHVARESSNIWGVSSRGFNGRFANKQLVMIDGRVVYDHFFAGVMWDIQQPMLADVSQIEVIRGPGATLWGANAVNGVINVSTLSARDTQGVLFKQTLGYGDLQDRTELRYGGKLADDAYYRVYGQYLQYDNTDYLTGESSQDNWNLSKGGFRFDFGKPGETNLTVQGELYGSDRIGTSWNQETLNPAVVLSAKGEDEVFGGHLLARLGKESAESGWALQLVYDRVDRLIHNLDTRTNILDIDFRHHFRPDNRNEMVWGLGVRHIMDETEQDGIAQVFFDPADETVTVFSGFIQNTYAIIPEQVFFMIGSKFEHNDYTGFEIEPSARLWWTPNKDHTFWSSISRSIRLPTRVDLDPMYNLPAPIPAASIGTKDLESEIAWTYEVGYRTRAIKNVTLDVTGYVSNYNHLIGATIIPNVSLVPPENQGSGQNQGFEVAAQWQVRNDLVLGGGYSFSHESLDDVRFRTSAATPEQMFHLSSRWDMTRAMTLDSHLYYVDNWYDGSTETPSYYRLDMGLRYKISDSTEVALWGQNLLDDRHPEVERSAEDVYGGVSEIGRSVFMQVTCKF